MCSISISFANQSKVTNRGCFFLTTFSGSFSSSFSSSISSSSLLSDDSRDDFLLWFEGEEATGCGSRISTRPFCRTSAIVSLKRVIF